MEYVLSISNHCAGDTELVSPCANQPCDWETDAACSKPCGGGAHNLTRPKTRNASGNGLPYLGENSQKVHCNETLCPGVLTVIGSRPGSSPHISSHWVPLLPPQIFSPEHSHHFIFKYQTISDSGNKTFYLYVNRKNIFSGKSSSQNRLS